MPPPPLPNRFFFLVRFDSVGFWEMSDPVSSPPPPCTLPLSLPVSRKHHKQDRFRSSVGAIKGRKLCRRICRERPVQHIHTWGGGGGGSGFLKAQPPTNPPKPPDHRCRSGSEATFITCIMSPRASKWRKWLCRRKRKEGWGEEKEF